MIELHVATAVDIEFELSIATHKQSERVYIFQALDEYGIRWWQYSMNKPSGEPGLDYTIAVDADEAFNIVQKRNQILFNAQ